MRRFLQVDSTARAWLTLLLEIAGFLGAVGAIEVVLRKSIVDVQNVDPIACVSTKCLHRWLPELDLGKPVSLHNEPRSADLDEGRLSGGVYEQALGWNSDVCMFFPNRTLERWQEVREQHEAEERVNPRSPHELGSPEATARFKREYQSHRPDHFWHREVPYGVVDDLWEVSGKAVTGTVSFRIRMQMTFATTDDLATVLFERRAFDGHLDEARYWQMAGACRTVTNRIVVKNKSEEFAANARIVVDHRGLGNVSLLAGDVAAERYGDRFAWALDLQPLESRTIYLVTSDKPIAEEEIQAWSAIPRDISTHWATWLGMLGVAIFLVFAWANLPASQKPDEVLGSIWAFLRRVVTRPRSLPPGEPPSNGNPVVGAGAKKQ